ncbi:hypothetical protein OC845_006847, partial [Tilletia horrida]
SLAALAADQTSSQPSRDAGKDGIPDFWTEVSLLAPPPSLLKVRAFNQTSITSGARQADAIPSGLSVSISLKDLTSHLEPLDFEWRTVPASSPNVALRFWPSIKQEQNEQVTSANQTAAIKVEGTDVASAIIHLVSDWHSHSLYVPSSACALLSRRMATFESEQRANFAVTLAQSVIRASDHLTQTAGPTTINAVLLDALPHDRVLTSFVLRLAEALSKLSPDGLSNSDAFGLVLSSTLICPYAIALRRWDARVPNLPAGITTLDHNRFPSMVTDQTVPHSRGNDRTSVWSRMRRVSTKSIRPPAIKKATTDRDVDCNADCNADSNVDVNNDGAATGPGSSSEVTPVSRATQVGSGQASAGDGTTINPNPTSTSTSNAGTGVGVAVGLQSAAAGVATHGPTFSVVQGCSDNTGGGTGATPTKSISNAYNTFNIGLGFSIKLPFRSDKSREERDRQADRERTFALQLAAAKNATSSAAVAVAVPGSSASASTSAAAGEHVSVETDSKANTGREDSQSTGVVKPSRVEPGQSQDPVSTGAELRAVSQKTHAGQGQVNYTFVDREPEVEEHLERIDEEDGSRADHSGEAYSLGTSPGDKTASRSGAKSAVPEEDRGEIGRARPPGQGMTTKTTVTTTTVTTVDRYPTPSTDSASRPA